MSFVEFERLVLRVLYETGTPLTAPTLAYIAGVPLRTAESHLARMAADGALRLRANIDGEIEFSPPGRKRASGVSSEEATRLALAEVLRRPIANPWTAVLLSMVIPGAGHIYAGRATAGVAWMATTLAGYACCFLPGLFLHGLCLVSAAQPRQN